ncbi:hypothetical protein BCR32DRAFT_266901 [Anaeromyces robustus]|uniref:Uncharacterized protein n=1 Tax=Anaeromyces robustus TaxID=1754192 RepID=A0A1Y1XCT1_9FUNG|nr:hypothetical protein BCR32DRAFT_266901 [Anaeromyces robustus]|eukprot:ORX83527.1 hypothetical protein BCR32DRAFT_266901 [Anaeromyces robustus]
MSKVRTRKNNTLILGMLGSICYATGDWIMMYGDATLISQKIGWFTKGTAQIPGWKNNLAMLLSYPGTILYAICLFSFERYIPNEKHKKIFHCLNIINLTPWMALHLIYIVILYAFHFMMTEGYEDVAIPISEALYNHFSWIIIMSLLFMMPLFLYFFWLLITGRTTFKKSMALAHMIPIMLFLICITLMLPESGFKMGFKNGLSNESLFISFLIFYIHSCFTSIADTNDVKDS